MLEVLTIRDADARTIEQGLPNSVSKILLEGYRFDRHPHRNRWVEALSAFQGRMEVTARCYIATFNAQLKTLLDLVLTRGDSRVGLYAVEVTELDGLEAIMEVYGQTAGDLKMGSQYRFWIDSKMLEGGCMVASENENEVSGM